MENASGNDTTNDASTPQNEAEKVKRGGFQRLMAICLVLITLSAIVGVGIMGKQTWHNEQCRRYKDAFILAYSNPDATSLKGLSEKDRQDAIDTRAAFKKKVSTTTIAGTHLTGAEWDLQRAERAWSAAEPDWQRDALARRGC